MGHVTIENIVQVLFLQKFNGKGYIQKIKDDITLSRNFQQLTAKEEEKTA